jgi:hypothetical protein
MLEQDALRGARPDLRGESMSTHRFLPGIPFIGYAEVTKQIRWRIKEERKSEWFVVIANIKVEKKIPYKKERKTNNLFLLCVHAQRKPTSLILLAVDY